MEVTKIQALGRDPIPGGDPAGENARYDSEYERVAAEIGKLESIEQETPDYYEIERLCTDLLASRTKDFKIASWLTIALYRENGLWGLAHGLGTCHDLMLNFWDGMFPPASRERARVTLLEWLSELIEKDFEKLAAATESDRDPLELCLSNLESIESLSRDRFSGDQPALGPAIRAVRGQLGSIPAPEPEPAPEPVASESAEATAEAPASAPPPPPPPPEPAELSSPEDVARALPEWREEMRKAAAILRRAEPAAPDGYRLLREACWGDLHRLPDSIEVNCPGDDFVATVEKLLTEEEYEDVLETVEETLAAHPLWLDLNLFASRALEGLGRKYRKVTRAIEDEVRALVRRLPDLPELAFADGRPLAGEETRIWISNELSDQPSETTDEQDQPSLEQLAAEARRLLSRKKVNEAVTLLVRNIDSASSRRARFLMRLELARLCMEAGNPAMAVPQLDLLDQEVQKFSLEEWEPELSMQVVRLLWQCCSGKKKVDTLADRADSIYERLCRLDPAAALTVKRP